MINENELPSNINICPLCNKGILNLFLVNHLQNGHNLIATRLYTIEY